MRRCQRLSFFMEKRVLSNSAAGKIVFVFSCVCVCVCVWEDGELSFLRECSENIIGRGAKKNTLPAALYIGENTANSISCFGVRIRKLDVSRTRRNTPSPRLPVCLCVVGGTSGHSVGRCGVTTPSNNVSNCQYNLWYGTK